MVQFLIDIVHMIAALALSLVGISYERSGEDEETDQAGLFQTQYSYVALEKATPQAGFVGVMELVTPEMPHAVQDTQSSMPLLIRLDKLELDVVTYDIQFDDNRAAPEAPQPPESARVIEGGCSTDNTPVLTQAALRGI